MRASRPDATQHGLHDFLCVVRCAHETIYERAELLEVLPKQGIERIIVTASDATDEIVVLRRNLDATIERRLRRNKTRHPYLPKK